MTAPENVRVVDLDDAPESILVEGDTLHAIVRLHGRPVGWIRTPTEGDVVTVATLLEETAKDHRDQVVWAATRERLSPDPPGPLPGISVVVCTRDRPERLAACLAALAALDYPEFEVVVVDNAPTDDRTRAVAERFGVRWIVEPLPGLDRARNRGIEAAQHDVLAFTDDDTRPDRLWLRFLGRAFTVPDVSAVTGLIAPVRVHTRAERLFELSYGGMGKGFVRKTVHGTALSSRQLLWACSFGAGANMSFRREALERAGRFDPCLDVGTPTGGAGDLDMLHRVLVAGGTLVYEPAAIVLHEHRASMASLRRQLFDNGRGFTCYLLTCARNRTQTRAMIWAFALRQWLWGWVVRRLIRPRGFPRRLILAELTGTLLAPWFYRASRRLR